MLFYKLLQIILFIPFRLIFLTKVKGKKNLVKGGAVLMANHQSYLDTPLLALNIFKYQVFIAKKELFNKKIMRFVLKRAGAIGVNRNKVEISAIKASLNALKQGRYLTIFPQGTRVPNGKMQNLKAGGILFSVKSLKPIIPIWIEKRPRPFVLNKMIIGEPIYPQSFGTMPANQLMQEIETALLKFYAPLEQARQLKHKSKKTATLNNTHRR